MAKYRKGWNGLEELKAEPVFIPEVMELEVFEIPRKVRIKVEPMKKSRKNIWLKGVTAAAGAAVVASCAAIEGAFPRWAGIVLAVSVGWLLLFTFANRRWK